MPTPTTDLPDVKLMVVALRGDDMVKSQNAAGVLAYLAISSKECRKAISMVDGVAEALAQLIASENVGLQHNAALLLGQLSTGADFRRIFASQPNALSTLINRLTSDDPDIQCNVAWALRQLVADGTHREAMIKARTASSLRPLLSSTDERVKTNALALIEVLRRPPKIQTDASKEQGALVGLASLSSAGSASDSECFSNDSRPSSNKLKRPKPKDTSPKDKRLRWAINTTKLGSSRKQEESPRVESAEEGINALLSATMGV